MGMKTAGYDTDPKRSWFRRFEVLSLITDHRKILNRQPEIRHSYDADKVWYQFWKIRDDVMSN